MKVMSAQRNEWRCQRAARRAATRRCPGQRRFGGNKQDRERTDLTAVNDAICIHSDARTSDSCIPLARTPLRVAILCKSSAYRPGRYSASCDGMGDATGTQYEGWKCVPRRLTPRKLFEEGADAEATPATKRAGRTEKVSCTSGRSRPCFYMGVRVSDAHTAAPVKGKPESQRMAFSAQLEDLTPKDEHPPCEVRGLH